VLVQQERWAENEESQAFLREAEELIEGSPTADTQVGQAATQPATQPAQPSSSP
jgi:hypothetical protein